MWSSRDVTLVIMFAALSFINFAAVLQLFASFTGIPGIVYGVDIIGAILATVGFLMFQGRRWRITVMGVLLYFLSLILSFGGTSFIFMTRIPIILKLFMVDLLFNTFYGILKKKDKLTWLAIIQSVFFFTISPFFDIVFYSLFVPFETLTPLLYLVTIMLPLIIGLSITGGYIGYKIYKRLEKLPLNT